MYSCVLLDVLTLFLRNRWYQAPLNNYSWEDVTVVSLMQKPNIHKLMSLGFHVWGFAVTKQLNGNSQLFGCGPPLETPPNCWKTEIVRLHKLSYLHFNKNVPCSTTTILYSQTGWLLFKSAILPFHLQQDSWTNNPTKWSGVSYLYRDISTSLIYSTN